jgi:hypothetical protein
MEGKGGNNVGISHDETKVHFNFYNHNKNSSTKVNQCRNKYFEVDFVFFASIIIQSVQNGRIPKLLRPRF